MSDQDRQKIITAQEFTILLFRAKQQMQNKPVFLDRFSTRCSLLMMVWYVAQLKGNVWFSWVSTEPTDVQH